MTAALTVQEVGAVQSAEKTFWAIVEKWLEDIKNAKNRKERTLSVYRYNMGVYKNWLDAEGIEQATRQNIKDWKESMKLKGWSASTINLYLATVRSFYKWLAENHNVTNIAAGIEGLKNSKEHKRGTLSLEEMKELLNVIEPFMQEKIFTAKAKLEALKKAAETQGKTFKFEKRLSQYEKTARLQCKRDKAILSALMAGGLRTCEISRLRVCDFKPDGGVYYLHVLGKGRDERESVKISRKAARVIDDWLKAREAVDVVFDDSPLFCSVSNNSFGEALTSLSVSRLVKEYLRAAGLKEKKYSSVGRKVEVKPIVAHSLRGSLATNAFRNGASLDFVKQQLRHVNISTTQIYLEEARKSLNPCSDIISDAIF